MLFVCEFVCLFVCLFDQQQGIATLSVDHQAHWHALTFDFGGRQQSDCDNLIYGRNGVKNGPPTQRCCMSGRDRLRNSRNAIARLAKGCQIPCFIALDKNPGVCPIAIGEVLRRLTAKCVLSVANGETQDCRPTQCGQWRNAGLPA